MQTPYSTAAYNVALESSCTGQQYCVTDFVPIDKAQVDSDPQQNTTIRNTLVSITRAPAGLNFVKQVHAYLISAAWQKRPLPSGFDRK